MISDDERRQIEQEILRQQRERGRNSTPSVLTPSVLTPSVLTTPSIPTPVSTPVLNTTIQPRGPIPNLNQILERNKHKISTYIDDSLVPNMYKNDYINNLKNNVPQSFDTGIIVTPYK
jgi:hypothetical protein